MMKLPKLFSNGCVLQRGNETAIWGEAAPGAKVKCEFLSKSYETTADEQGLFRLMLQGLTAGGPYCMRLFENDDVTVIEDVYIGDVWLLYGQSNIQLMITRVRARFNDEVKDFAEPAIRMFQVPMQYGFGKKVNEMELGEWVGARPETIDLFSAVGFFMARKLYQEFGIPIGLLQSGIGGVTAESFISEETLLSLGGYEEELTKNKDEAYVKGVIAEEQRLISGWYKTLDEKDPGVSGQWYLTTSSEQELPGWKDIQLPGIYDTGEWQDWHGSLWVKKDFYLTEETTEECLLVLGVIVDADQTYINGTAVGRTEYCYPPRRYKVPGSLLKKGRNTVTVRVISTGFPWAFTPDKAYILQIGTKTVDLSGLWKYHLGANMPRRIDETFFQYKPSGLYNGMLYPIRNYAIAGACFYQGESNAEEYMHYEKVFKALISDFRALWKKDMPFFFVQLPNFSNAVKYSEATDWAELRETQRAALSVPGTAMVVTIDVGEYNDLHPLDKKSVGERLAACIGAKYHGVDQVYQGPLVDSCSCSDGKITVSFTSVGSGLTIMHGKAPLACFEVCDSDGKWYPAQAEISGDQVVVAVPGGRSAKGVRYAFRNNPNGSNLYNKEGFPASPFRMYL